ncbi:MAG: phage tail sheath C-terminal domain-containing protein [Polyangiales bacterium]|jgi:phage tail sheath protein FI
MPEYQSPGVYIEEIGIGPRPIRGVGTSTAGFVGLTEHGPTRPRMVSSWEEYTRWFGDLIDPGISFLPFAAKGFFDNGGARLFVARITRSDATRSMLDAPTSTKQNLRISANGPGAWGDRIFVRFAPSGKTNAAENATGFRLTAVYFRTVPGPFVDPLDPDNIGNPDRVEPDVVEDYDDLCADPLDSNYVLRRINKQSTLIEVEWTDDTIPGYSPRFAGFAQLMTEVGDDGGNTISAREYEGDLSLPRDQRTGLASLEIIDEVALLCVPDEVHSALDGTDQTRLTNAVIDQCEGLRDRFAVLQVPGGQRLAESINPPRETSYAAIYYPWVRCDDPFTRDTRLVPPGGHVAGIYARSDRERGVHKAPANEIVRGIVNRDINATRRPLEFTVGKAEQDILNPRGINVIRDFRAEERGVRVWGARTLSSDPQWRYVNVRRLFNFVRESIDEGTQWVVFESNDENTWAQIRQATTNFLSLVWRSGALQGATAEQALFVRCGQETMTPADIDAGRLICEIGIAPVKPAEFIMFTIHHKTVESAV